MGRIEPAIAVAGSLARHFLGLIHRRDVSGFDRWLVQASDCAGAELRRIAAGLKADLSAVRAAFTSQWSSGQVEGQVDSSFSSGRCTDAPSSTCCACVFSIQTEHPDVT